MVVHYLLDEVGYPYRSWVGEHEQGCLTDTVEGLNAIINLWVSVNGPRYEVVE